LNWQYPIGGFSLAGPIGLWARDGRGKVERLEASFLIFNFDLMARVREVEVKRGCSNGGLFSIQLMHHSRGRVRPSLSSGGFQFSGCRNGRVSADSRI
jgi:hypothetical protein